MTEPARPDRTELNEQLAQLNAAVTEAVATRTRWMDEHMADYARFAIGERVYDLNTGRDLGTVVCYYRYWAESSGHGGGAMGDTSMHIDYTLTSGEGRTGLRLGSWADLVRHRQRELGRLTAGSRPLP